MNEFHEANRKYWNASAAEWQQREKGDWRECAAKPTLAFEGQAFRMINEFIGELTGKRVCIIGSGDNCAAFALAKLGAEVTSTDISRERLDLAAQHADALGLNIRFLRCDATNLESVLSDAFHLVCSTNGFFVWISDLVGVFREVARVLKPGGYYIFYDIHPFMRPWKEQTAIEMLKPYAATGPFTHEESGVTIYNYHWTVSNIINSLIESGLNLCRIFEDTAEYPRFWSGYSHGHGGSPDLLNWEKNPRAGLPAWLTVAALKPVKI
jgi:SAM-dependent methyltransferase